MAIEYPEPGHPVFEPHGRCAGCARSRVLCELDDKACNGCDCGLDVGRIPHLFGMPDRQERIKEYNRARAERERKRRREERRPRHPYEDLRDVADRLEQEQRSARGPFNDEYEYEEHKPEGIDDLDYGLGDWR